MITKFSCACGANSPSDAVSYDGHIGYEAIVCRKCGRYWDEFGEHEPDKWSKIYVIPTPTPAEFLQFQLRHYEQRLKVAKTTEERAFLRAQLYNLKKQKND